MKLLLFGRGKRFIGWRRISIWNSSLRLGFKGSSMTVVRVGRALYQDVELPEPAVCTLFIFKTKHRAEISREDSPHKAVRAGNYVVMRRDWKDFDWGVLVEFYKEFPPSALGEPEVETQT